MDSNSRRLFFLMLAAVVTVHIHLDRSALMRTYAADQPTVKGPAIPARAADARPQLLDLSRHYNASLADAWHGDPPGNDLASLPTGVHRLAGVEFDLRGVVQLSSRAFKLAQPKYPEEVKGIEVGLKVQRLHLLQACGWRMARPDTRLGAYVVHYAGGKSREIPIIYGKDVQDWHNWEPLPPSDSCIAWAGVNLAGRRLGTCIRLFKSTWENPSPSETVTRIDFISAMQDPAPFLIAITAE
jgi:hypothetical protein